MALNLVFDPILSRVRLEGTALDPAPTALFERSRNGSYWTTVRGGSAVAVDGSDVAKLDDYEFEAGKVNYYRVTAGSDVFTANITPTQTGVWLKSITRPFLNRAVEVVDHSDITRPARNGVFEVIGRSFPIAVTDVRGSRRWNMTVKVETPADADAFDLVLASGDPLYIQTDGQHDIPGGYVVVGDSTRRRFGHASQRRWFDLPCTEVAAPGPDVVGVTITWDLLMAEYGSWTAVLAAFGSWSDILEYVADPSVVIVP
jgi:hypothetical protein